MIKGLKNIFIAIITGINVFAILAMVAVGYSPYIDAVGHPLLSSMGLCFPITLAINAGFLVLWMFLKLKMICLPIVGFILVAGPLHTYMPLNTSDTIPGGAIKVMSLNIKSYWGMDGEVGAFDRLVEYIQTEQPDILCLQEDGGPHSKQFRKRKDLFPHNSTTVIGKGKKTNGLGIYSKFPIVKSEHIEYTSTGNASVAFFLLIDGDSVMVINNHLESTHLSPDQRQQYKDILTGRTERDSAEATTKMLIRQLADATKIRAPQADAVAEYIERHSGYPLIVCGDFNDSPISYTHRKISGNLTDCFIETGCGIGISYNQSGFWVRIDNILCSRHFTPYGCKVDSEAELSDHYPIYCWLKREENN